MTRRSLWLCSAVFIACSACSDDDDSSPSVADAGTDAGSADATLSTDAASRGATSASEGEARAKAKAAIGDWGFDLSGMEHSVKPGDSFYEYANGAWLRENEIPADRTRWGTFNVLSDENELQLRSLIDGLPEDADEGSNAQKVRDYFETYVDAAAIEQLGLGPAEVGLSAIGAAKTHEDIVRLMSRSELGLYSPVRRYVGVDEKDPSRYVVYIVQSGLGLPDRDYYLSDAPVYRELCASYEEHIVRMLTLIGSADPEREAAAILALETAIAEQSWPVEKRRDRTLTYNARTRNQLSENTGDFSWQAALDEAGLGDQQDFVISELDAVESLARSFSSVPVADWIAYLQYHYVTDHAQYLPASIDDERFEFYSKTLNGQQQQRDRWKRGIASVNAALGEAVGELYVERYFPESSKSAMEELVMNLRTAFSKRIDSLPWMTRETKVAAQRKLDTFLPNIGYPDKWKDYSELEARPGDAFGNAVRARVWRWNEDLDRLGRPTDRSEWGTTPQTVNAYYNSVFNAITFPAAILQPPFFDPAADPAINYGGIGAVIGHEMGHGFDDQGAKSDENGVLRTWWQPEDEQAFQVLVQALVAQYDRYEALPGLHIKGQLTVGENIGDLGGMSIAYAAYRLSLGDEEAPVLDGLTGDQRFFLSWAQVWRELSRDQALRNLVMSDPHSPARFRVEGVVRNIDAWYDAFDVQPDDALYLAPEDRVHIW